MVLLIGDCFEFLDLSGPLQVIAEANRLQHAYEAVTASPSGGLVAAGAGPAIATERLAAIDSGSIDTVLVIGGAQADSAQGWAIAGWLRRHAREIRRVCAIGPGIELIARAALVPRAACAVHWRSAGASGGDPRKAAIARRYGSGWTCAGKIAAIDLSLTLVAEDLGRPAALAAAEALLAFVWRDPADPQVSDLLSLQIRGGAPFAHLFDRIRANLDGRLDVETLADWCHMSPRTFARRFVRQTGTTPAAAVAAMRLEAARTLLGAGSLGRKEVATLCGFGSELNLRRALERGRERA